MMPMPSLYLINHARGFRCPCIAKNGCTSLKALIASDDDRHTVSDGPEAVLHLHDYFGYRADGRRLIRPDDQEFLGYRSFAVWRDPVERFFSLYRDKLGAGRRCQDLYLQHGLLGASVETFLAYAENQLATMDHELVDEHIRPQVAYYCPAEVDWIVPLERLEPFLAAEFQVSQLPRLNRGPPGVKKMVGESLTNRVRTLYHADLALPERWSEKVWNEHSPDY